MTAPHPSWPWISSAVFYDDAGAAIDWLCKAFGFEVRLKIEGDAGRIEHSELTFGGGLIMVASKTDQSDPTALNARSPQSLEGANTQALCVYVEDVDAHFRRAKAAGATVVREPTTDDYGDEHGAHRTYGVRDPEGHHWWFMRVARDPRVSE